MNGVRILAAGEQGIVIELGNTICTDINARVHKLAKGLVDTMGSDIVEVVPTYRSLLVYFDPLQIQRQQLVKYIENVIANEKLDEVELLQSKVVNIPVCYDDEFGPDLQFVAQYNGLTVDEVITIHTASPYLVYMLGFTPGFPYLGGMSERIATPRLEKPRTRIVAGSVGIAGSQTGFYPIDSPGGWRLIGRTPLRAFQPEAAQPFLFDAGVYLQFQAINRQEYDEIKQVVAAGRYVATTGTLILGGANHD
ncbi:MAG: pxpB [Firmicutes bacterium]|nr:pxpB [Bacillota bacterium]